MTCIVRFFIFALILSIESAANADDSFDDDQAAALYEYSNPLKLRQNPDVQLSTGIRTKTNDRDTAFALAGLPALAQDAYLKASNVDGDDGFGSAVAMDRNTLVIGAPFEDSSAFGVNGDQTNNLASASGAVYVFVREAGNWLQQAYLKASNTDENDLFGWSVAVDGDTLVVSAIGEDSGATGVDGNQSNNSAIGSGAVYVFVREAGEWNQQAYLKASNTDANDQFGTSVAVSGTTLVVGAPQEDSTAIGVDGNQSSDSRPDSGAAYVFVREAGVWSQQAYLKASNTGGISSSFSDLADRFGTAVAISSDTLVVSAIGEDSNATGVNGNQSNNSALDSGAAYIFIREGTTWSQQAYLKASNPGGLIPSFPENVPGDEFGHAVALSGDVVAVASINEDSSATGANGNQSNNGLSNSGAVYIFARDENGWNQQSYLKASNTGPGDRFGSSIALSDGYLVVGAPNESSNSTGVNSDQSNNLAFRSGAVYVFKSIGSAWGQQFYLKPLNTEENDRFGSSVAVSGSQVLSGAIFEDSNATGVNGNQANNALADSGAAYLFGFDSFTIGGTVAGLMGSGLVLQNSGGDDLEISSNGAFTFDTPVIDGESYSVNVTVQPASPDQICSVTNGSGTVNGETVTNIQILCQLLPDISVMPSILDFGEQLLGITTASQMVVVESTGEGDLAIDPVTLKGPQASDYQITMDSCSGATLSTAAVCGIDVAFTANAPGVRSAWVEIRSNASNSPNYVNLIGTNDVLFFDGFEQD